MPKPRTTTSDVCLIKATRWAPWMLKSTSLSVEDVSRRKQEGKEEKKSHLRVSLVLCLVVSSSRATALLFNQDLRKLSLGRVISLSRFPRPGEHLHSGTSSRNGERRYLLRRKMTEVVANDQWKPFDLKDDFNSGNWFLIDLINENQMIYSYSDHKDRSTRCKETVDRG